MMRSLRGALSSLVVAVAASGCAVHAVRPAVSALDVVAAVRKAGFALDNPLALDPETVEEIRDRVGTSGNEPSRMRRAVQYLTDLQALHFTYEPSHTLSAQEAFRQHRGDCMAFANLLTATARALEIPTRFVRITDVNTYYEHDGAFFLTSHMAVSQGIGSETVVFDYAARQSEWRRLVLYRPVDDASAAALYFNNLAVDMMHEGRLADSERLLELLKKLTPQLEDVYSNLGVVLIRQRRYDEALAVLQAGMKVNPGFRPLYVNALQAAEGAHQPELAMFLEERARQVAGNDPVYLFSQGLRLYQSENYAGAVQLFHRALSTQPDNPVILSWMVRAYLSTGDRSEGRDLFRHLRDVAPNHPLVRELQHQFPELAG